jgi:uncharacterized protein (DUF305 family)
MIEKNASFSRHVAAVLCAVAFLATGLGASAQPHGGAKSDGSMQLKDSMMKGMKEMDSMKTTGDTDHDFAMMMKMHHQQALDMAKIEVEQGKSAEMKAMARKIIEAQKKEIAEFDKWLRKH